MPIHVTTDHRLMSPHPEHVCKNGLVRPYLGDDFSLLGFYTLGNPLDKSVIL